MAERRGGRQFFCRSRF